MKKIDILIKSIILLYRETLLEHKSGDSADLINNILPLISGRSKDMQVMGSEPIIIDELKQLIKELIKHNNGYDQETLIQSLEIILKDKPELVKVAKTAILADLEDKRLKRSILGLRNILTVYHDEEESKKLISKASIDLNTNNVKNVSVKEYVMDVIAKLDMLNNRTIGKDPGIVDEVDISDDAALSEVLDRAAESGNEGSKLISGWKELNTMTQNGFRRGEFWMIDALQHSYKSGFTQSLTCQLPMHNKPVLKDNKKKPLMIYLSLEDDTEIFTTFMYRYLYYNENDKLPDMSVVTGKDMSSYIKKKLTVNGYHVKLLRVNPSEWTYRDLQNLVIKYESDGYEVHSVIVDYLSKLPTTGCITSGPIGTDMRDLFNRIRNFMSSKSILFITPHQLSSDAKQLIRNDISPLNFVKEIEGKGYTEGSKQLDQVVDGELYLHKVKQKGKWFLTVQRGKHRYPGILPDEDKYFILPFPENAPIKENLNDTSDSIKTLSLDGSDDFDF